MKKYLKIIVIIIVVAILAIDFYGLWKYKLSGKKYVIETGSEDDAAVEEDSEDSSIEYEDLTSETISALQALFIKNIEKVDNEYEVKGVVYEQYEISKDDYNTLRAGEGVEIFGKTYVKGKIKSNNMILKNDESSESEYYVTYDTKNKKYILMASKTESPVFKTTEKNVKITVSKGVTFATVKSGKTSNKKIEDVVEAHKDLTEPDGETANISTATLTFDKNGKCTKITETIR